MIETQEKTSHPLGEWVKKNRESRGWSLRYLADRMGNVCDASFISQLENNKYFGKKGKPMQPAEPIVSAFAEVFHAPLNMVRSLAGYPPLLGESDTVLPADPLDSELALLFAASRDWSEENRREAYGNAKVIFERYLKKEEEKRRGATPLEEFTNDVSIEPRTAAPSGSGGGGGIIDDYDGAAEDSGEVPIETATDDDLRDVPRYKIENGKLTDANNDDRDAGAEKSKKRRE